MLNRKKSPEISLTNQAPMDEPKGFHLGNGLPVYCIRGGTEEMVSLELVFSAGSYDQPKPLVALAATKLLTAGTKGKGRQQINEAFDYHGVMLRLEASKDIISVGIQVLNKHLKVALALFQEILFQPVYPEDEISTFLSNQRQLHLVNQKKVLHLARTYFAEMVYGEKHPYGYRIKTDDFDAPTREDLLDFHRRYIHPGNAFCVVSGQLPENIGQLADTYLGLKQETAVVPGKSPGFPLISPGSRKMHLQVPGALQSAIRIGKQLINRTHPAYHKVKIANALLGGYYGSRLMQNIRQDKGYTYGVSSSIVSFVRDGYFFVSTQVGADVCQQATEEIYNEIRGLRTRPAAPEARHRKIRRIEGHRLVFMVHAKPR